MATTSRPVNKYFQPFSPKRHFSRGAHGNQARPVSLRNFQKVSSGGDVILQGEGFALRFLDSGLHQVSDGNQPHKTP